LALNPSGLAGRALQSSGAGAGKRLSLRDGVALSEDSDASSGSSDSEDSAASVEKNTSDPTIFYLNLKKI
jgi:hypothetical protein